MMPLSLAKIGEENIVARVRGNSEVKRHLNNLGIVEGGKRLYKWRGIHPVHSDSSGHQQGDGAAN